EDFVVAGGHATLEWAIQYPVILDPEGNPQTDAVMKVRLIGSAINPNHNLHFGATFNGGDFETLYRGAGELSADYDIIPGEVVRELEVEGGTEVDFHVRVEFPNGSTTQWTSTNDPARQHMIIRLMDGDAIPYYRPVTGQSTIEELLASYAVDGHVDVGPNDVIVTLEAYTPDVNHPDYDMQDMIVLISYEAR
ncbi:MAG: hypothetical protein AAGC74_12730, partial [Verrucomicrobiota bacterium]